MQSLADLRQQPRCIPDLISAMHLNLRSQKGRQPCLSALSETNARDRTIVDVDLVAFLMRIFGQPFSEIRLCLFERVDIQKLAQQSCRNRAGTQIEVDLDAPPAWVVVDV